VVKFHLIPKTERVLPAPETIQQVHAVKTVSVQMESMNLQLRDWNLV